MYTTIVNSIIALILKYYGNNYSLDDINFAIEVAFSASNITWSDGDYSDMFDDIILGLEHPGESFIEPTKSSRF